MIIKIKTTVKFITIKLCFGNLRLVERSLTHDRNSLHFHESKRQKQ